MTTDVSDLPPFPQARPARCPFDPPQDYRDWQAGPGLQKVRLWNGSTPWAVTRYEDIRVALSDPRISADARRPDFPHMSPGQAHAEEDFPRIDDPEHARYRRMLTRDFTVRQAEEMRPWITQLVDDTLEKMGSPRTWSPTSRCRCRPW